MITHQSSHVDAEANNKNTETLKSSFELCRLEALKIVSTGFDANPQRLTQASVLSTRKKSPGDGKSFYPIQFDLRQRYDASAQM